MRNRNTPESLLDPLAPPPDGLVALNTVTTIAEVVVVGVLMFILYRSLLHTLGPAQIGLWSVVIASSSASQVANVGFSGSVVKYVARYAARREMRRIEEVVGTSAIVVGLALACVLSVFYIFRRPILGTFIEPLYLPLALRIIPLTLGAVWFMSMAGLLLGVLDGYQVIYWRNGLRVAGNLVYVTLAVRFARSWGIVGVAYANLIEYVFLVLITAVVIRSLKLLRLASLRWSVSRLKEMLGYGANVQIMAATQFLFDPLTKAFLARFGSMSVLGFYELAQKMTEQLRTLLVAAVRVLIPKVASLTELEPSSVDALYVVARKSCAWLAMGVFGTALFALPGISRLWIGHVESAFMVCAAILLMSALANVVSAPAYVMFLGIGELRWNTVGHLGIAFANVALGLALGSLWGSYGVVVGWAIAFAGGSTFILYAYERRRTDKSRKGFRGAGLLQLAALAVSLLLALTIIRRSTVATSGLTPMAYWVMGILWFLGVAVPLLVNPVGHEVVQRAKDLLFPRERGQR